MRAGTHRRISAGRALALTALVGGPVALAVVVMAPCVLAQTAGAKAVVDAAKSANRVGEQADGFLGVVSGADPETRGAVAQINAGRAEAYQAIAARTGVSADAAGQATARELIARLPPGASYKPMGGDWRRK